VKEGDTVVLLWINIGLAILDIVLLALVFWLIFGDDSI
jgi:hypothetical protein